MSREAKFIADRKSTIQVRCSSINKWISTMTACYLMKKGSEIHTHAATHMITHQPPNLCFYLYKIFIQMGKFIPIGKVGFFGGRRWGV